VTLPWDNRWSTESKYTKVYYIVRQVEHRSGARLGSRDGGREPVRAGSGEVLVGLGDNGVVANRSIGSERSILGGLSGLTAVGVQATVGLATSIELKVGLIQDNNGELTIRVGANVPLNQGLDASVNVGATEDGRLTIGEDGTLVVPVAGIQGSRVKVGGGAVLVSGKITSAASGDRAERDERKRRIMVSYVFEMRDIWGVMNRKKGNVERQEQPANHSNGSKCSQDK
jgi:hypothetical protein